MLSNVSDFTQDVVLGVDDEELVGKRCLGSGVGVDGARDAARCGRTHEGSISFDGSGERCLHF